MIAIRGAIRVERNDRDVIFRDTQRLLSEIVRRNDLREEDLLSVFFTMTPDLNADFPAYAAREMGWTDTAMLGAQETAVPGALDRMVRVLIHADVPGPSRHVYLGEAAAMRPDLAEAGDALEAELERPGEDPPFGTLLVVGLGLIGGSAALALRRRAIFTEILGHDVDPGALDLARRAGAVDRASGSAEELVGRADVVLLALPVGALLGWLERWGGELGAGTVVVDVGSTKERVVRALSELPESVEAVGAHPMAGSEESGMEAARPDLFYGAPWALVETERTGSRAREVAEAMVEGVGGRPFWTGAGPHDAATAATSHLPYIISCALARHVEGSRGRGPVRELLGPGAKGMLRLAGSQPRVMADILRTNWPRVREEVAGFREGLDWLFERLDREWSAATGEVASPGTGEMFRDVLEGARESHGRVLAGRVEGDREGADGPSPGGGAADGGRDADGPFPGELAADGAGDTEGETEESR